MKATWVVVADPSYATIYTVPRGMARLRQLAEIGRSPPAGGRGKGKPCLRDGRSSDQSPTDGTPGIDKFARQLAQYLEQARGDRQFDELILVAPPVLLSTLRDSLTQSLRDAVVAEIAKDLVGARQELLQEQVLRVL
jgi:protein required for attachment to host cells